MLPIKSSEKTHSLGIGLKLDCFSSLLKRLILSDSPLSRNRSRKFEESLQPYLGDLNVELIAGAAAGQLDERRDGAVEEV